MQDSNGKSPSITSPVHFVQTLVTGSLSCIRGHIPRSSEWVKISPSAARGTGRTHNVLIVAFHPCTQTHESLVNSLLLAMSRSRKVARQRQTNRLEIYMLVPREQ